MDSFKDKVIYQIYLKSFQDTDGDGLGDLNGVTRRLDYLSTLGVDYIWLTPFFVSPQKDNGYDVADYRNIDPRFGTMEDFEHLVSEAGKRDIGVMLDMVFNHTSTSHEWFKRALNGETEYQDYYMFRDGEPGAPPTNWQSKFGGSAWEYLPDLKRWYLHLFDVSQADLNWDNPRVREELKAVIRFWKEKGVSGFRFDVVNLISKPDQFEDDLEGDGRRFYTDGPHVHEYLKELTRDTGIGSMVTVGEMSSTSIENCIRYSNPAEKELSMCFNFHHLKIDYKDGNKWSLAEPDYAALKKLFETWQIKMQEQGGWNALFWCNHDQPRIVSRLGDDRVYWKESAKMLAACVHLMRGTPYIYQGEELGMTNAGYRRIEDYRDVESLNYYRILMSEGMSREEALHILAKRSRDNGRTPMQWDGTAGAGFTEGTPWISIPANHAYINAEAEIRDEDSIFHFYRKLTALRKRCRAVSEGTIRFVGNIIAGCGQDMIFAYEREYGGQRLLTICNLAGEEAELLKEYRQEYSLLDYEMVLGNYLDEGDPFRLRPYECRICLKHG